MKETDLNSILRAESQRKMDVSGCKNADELLPSVFASGGNRVSDEELDLIAAAAGLCIHRVEAVRKFKPHKAD